MYSLNKVFGSWIVNPTPPSQIITREESKDGGNFSEGCW